MTASALRPPAGESEDQDYSPSYRAAAIAAALVTWFLLFLLIYGTRIAAPAVVFGLAFAVPRPGTNAPRPRPKTA